MKRVLLVLFSFFFIFLPFLSAAEIHTIDFNNNKLIDLDDLILQAQDFGKSSNFDNRFDLNSNGKIDLFDVVSLTKFYGEKYTYTFPPSSVEEMNTNDWTFKVYESNNVQSDWLGLDENQVFYRRLEHKQTDLDWTIKIGKGGQIYSIKTPQTGEMIALQRISHGQWIDEVFQHTLPSYLHSKGTSQIVDGDIHQAGYYTRSDLDTSQQIIPKSIYSPTYVSFLSEFAKINNSFSLVTWPQHAHLPRTYSENGMVFHQNTRDLGNGVVEITLIINKWLGEETKDISVPWSAFRTQSLPFTVLSNSDGSYSDVTQTFNTGIPRRLKDVDTGGWIAFVKANNLNSYGIGIVYGKSPTSVENKTSYVRWGDYDSPEIEGIDGTVGTVKRNIVLNSGDSVYVRYYLIIGKLKDIQKYGNMLQSKVQAGKIETKEQNAKLIEICRHETKILRRGCINNEEPLFYAYRDFTTFAKPLFLLKDNSNSKIVLTTDPYVISLDPTDRKTEYIDFLGWAVPSQNADTTCLEYYSLSNVMTQNNLDIIFTGSENLRVRKNNINKCD